MEYRSRRHPALGRVSLRMPDGTDVPADLLDASEGGVKLQAVGHFEAGQRVELRAPRMTFSAQVRWVEDGELGLRFERNLAKSELEELAGKPFARQRSGTGRWMYGMS